MNTPTEIDPKDLRPLLHAEIDKLRDEDLALAHRMLREIEAQQVMNDLDDAADEARAAGGLKALSQVLAALPADFAPAIVVVQHLDPRHRSLMADILSRRSALPVKQADENDKLQPGNVYIAPPNKHLLVNPDGSLSLTQSELVHFVRPSADLLFESAAGSF